MGRFNDTNNKRNERNNKTERPNNFKKEKPKYVKVNVSIADSPYYSSSIDSIYNLLDSISFTKVAIPVYMKKSELFGNDTLKGTTVLGTIDKFNTDNTFTVSVQEAYADKITDKHVMSMLCKKDRNTGEITYIYSFTILEGKSVKSNFDDVEQAMLAAAEEATEEKTAEE